MTQENPTLAAKEEMKQRWKQQLLETFDKPVSVSTYFAKRKTHHWLPPYNQIIKEFGSWPDAMSYVFGSDVSVYRTNWTEEMIKPIVKQLIDNLGRWPSVTEYEAWHREHPNTPSVRTIERRFGSYGQLMKQLGQTDYRGIQIPSKEEVQNALTQYFQDATTPRTLKEYLGHARGKPRLFNSRDESEHFLFFIKI